jgi:RNA 2',3'-cyclic 3'-phosphodiesterase
VSTTHRLFAAIDMDDDARQAIGRAQAWVRRTLSDAAGSIAWVRPDHIHLTLVFLAAVPDHRLRALTDACSAPIPQAAFSMAFGGIGVFPPRGAPRVVWLGVAHGAADAARVQQFTSARIEALGIPVEHRPFRAHLTLGRWRNARPAEASRVRPLAKIESGAQVVVDEVVLYESRLSPSGSTYTPLTRAPLTAPPIE